MALVFGMALMAQTTIFKMYTSFAPDAALLMAVYCGLNYMKVGGYQIGILAGLFQDILSFGLLGINILSKGLLGFTAGWMRENHIIDVRSPNTWGMVIILATIADRIIMQVYSAGFFGVSHGIVDILGSIVIQSFVNVLVGVPFFYFLNKLQGQLKEFLGIREF